MNLSSIITFVESLGSDKLSLLSGKYEGGFRLQQVPDEISCCLWYFVRQNKKFKSYFEIGSAAGGTAFLFNHFLEFENIVLVDDNTYLRKTKQLELRKKVLNGVSYKEIIGDSKSQEVINKVDSLNMVFDIMFIDGDHSYKGIKNDIDIYMKYLAPGGYLILHDTVACIGVTKVFNELKQSNNLVLIQEYISKIHNKPCGIGVFKSKGE